jgi:hypothetical protein
MCYNMELRELRDLIPIEQYHLLSLIQDIQVLIALEEVVLNQNITLDL